MVSWERYVAARTHEVVDLLHALGRGHVGVEALQLVDREGILACGQCYPLCFFSMPHMCGSLTVIANSERMRGNPNWR